MQIGIDLENYTCPLEDFEKLVCAYGPMREVGYLKINPERIPVVVDEERAEKSLMKFRDYVTAILVKGDKYMLFADYRSVENYGDGFILFGNVYVARFQGRLCTGLTMTDIKDFLEILEKIPQAKGKGRKTGSEVKCFYFEGERNY